MADFHIYVGYRTVSSWSLRGWLPMKKAGVPVRRDADPLPHAATAGRSSTSCRRPARCRSSSTSGRTEARSRCGIRSPSPNTWPRPFPRRGCGRRMPVARAHARAIAAEMHSGFRRAAPASVDMALLERLPNSEQPAGQRRGRAHRGDVARVPRDAGARRAAGRSCSAAGSIADAAVRAGGDALPHLRRQARRDRRRLHGGGARRPGFPASGRSQAQKDPPPEPPVP